MVKARDQTTSGNINLARQLCLGAAERGLGEAAFALAQTYDPNELAKLKDVIGIQPDVVLAHKWYEKAAQLGYTGANGRK